MDTFKTTDTQGTGINRSPGENKFSTENAPNGLINGLFPIVLTNLLAELPLQTENPGLGKSVAGVPDGDSTYTSSKGLHTENFLIPIKHTELINQLRNIDHDTFVMQDGLHVESYWLFGQHPWADDSIAYPGLRNDVWRHWFGGARRG